MKFSKIIGHTDDLKIKTMVREAEEKLSSVFTELSLGYDNKSMGTGIGGDPLVFQLLYTLPQICDLTAVLLDELRDKEEDQKKRIENGETIPEEEKLPDDLKTYKRQMGSRALRTAATDGRRFYWNPEFVNSISKLGLRLVCFHEAFHAVYLHPQRRGSRLPRLFNIAVDYRVNFSAMEDLRSREIKDYPKVFTENLGEYIHLEEYAAFLRDPFNPPARLAHFNPTENLRKMADPAYVDPYGDVPPMYYADEALSDDMKRPENVYEYLLAQIPKCPKCGRLGKYKKPEEYKTLEKKIEEQKKKKAEEKKKEDAKKKKQDATQPVPNGHPEGCCKDHGDENHDHGEEGECCDHPGQQPGQGQGQEQGEGGQPGKDDGGSCCDGDKGCDPGCSGCGGDDSEYIDPFGAGETLDDHIDSDVSEEELSKRLHDAAEIAKKMAGKIPGALEDELGILTNPQISWEDIVRQQMTKKRNGAGKSDWMRPKSRPMFAGLYVPKKRDYFLNILCAYDCSGSMSKNDISHGISQLQVIDERGEIYLVGWDTQVYWDTMIKIKKADKENLQNAVVKGRGGTMVGDVFNQYEEHCDKLDMVIIITDGFIYDGELANVKRPDKDTQVLWLITSHNPNFKPAFGRVMHLHNEKM